MKDVVYKSTLEEGIVVVKMEDREYNNTFSENITKGLIKVFDEIKEDPVAKVVLIHGYDNYFCCGGTKEELINILEGRLRFNDLEFYRCLLDCSIPVVSAMQGHALGGGLVFGCYADIIVMAKECLYSANFMKYGFTPGMGGTYIIPAKFGSLLGHELLFSAKNYYGDQLRARGIPAQVVPKDQVISTAMELAKELADKPLKSLKLLKEHLSAPIKAVLPSIIEKELKMHEISFQQPEVRERIENLLEDKK